MYKENGKGLTCGSVKIVLKRIGNLYGNGKNRRRKKNINLDYKFNKILLED